MATPVCRQTGLFSLLTLVRWSAVNVHVCCVCAGQGRARLLQHDCGSIRPILDFWVLRFLGLNTAAHVCRQRTRRAHILTRLLVSDCFTVDVYWDCEAPANEPNA